jgi:hypothetical protein
MRRGVLAWLVMVAKAVLVALVSCVCQVLQIAIDISAYGLPV